MKLKPLLNSFVTTFSALAMVLALPGGALRAAESVEPVDYAAKIAPIFEARCVDCHAGDDADGEFSLETYELLLKGGKEGKAIEPGKAEESLLVKFLEGRSGKEGKNKFMPPGKKEHCSPEEIAVIRQWIDGGAKAPAVQEKPLDALAKLPKIAPKADHKKAVQALAFSPQAKVIAVGSYAQVQLLDAATRQPVRMLEGVEGKVNALQFSKDGAMLFAGAGDAGIGGIAYQWKVVDGSLVRKFEGHKDAIYGLALSPDGEMLATGSYDQKIKFWKVVDGSEIRTLNGHNGGVFGLSFRPDGKVLASASADRTVKLWDVATGKRLDTLSQPLKEQTTVAFAPDGKTVAAGGVDNRIRVWQVSDMAEEGSNPLLITRFAHDGAILNLEYSRDGQQLVSTAADKTVKVWKASDVTETHLLEPQSDWSPGLTLLDGGVFALGRLDGSLGFYDATTGKVAEVMKPAPAPAMKPKPALPEISRVDPRGVQSGAETKVKLSGKNLAGIKEVKFNLPGLSATVVQDEKGMGAELTVTAKANVPRTAVMMTVVTAAGESAEVKMLVDDLPQIVVGASKEPTVLDRMPINIWGRLEATGQRDDFKFSAKKDETIVFDLTAKPLESKLVAPRIEVYDAEHKLLAANNGLDGGSDPFLAFTAPRDGDYVVRVLEITLEGSVGHIYRLTAGMLPYVTGWWPLSVPANSEGTIHLVGPNLMTDSVTVKAGADGEVPVPANGANYRTRVRIQVMASNLPESLEEEPNDTPEQAQQLTIPASVNGRLFVPGQPDKADVDLYSFDAEQGQKLVIETRAAMLGSPADTKIEVLDAKGEPVPQVILQATKDSYLTLRSADSVSAGIRLGLFREMALNDYMYFNGEVVKINRLARGPDDDMVFFTRNGIRRAYFNTSAAGHGLDEPCYVVVAKPVGSTIVPNGLPVFTLNYVNDDDSDRELGKDSRLLFTAPAKGKYLVRVSDTRGWSGERFAYRLIVRAPEEDFVTTIGTKGEPRIAAGSGEQFVVKVDRKDGWEGDVRLDVNGVPPGFFVSSPVVVQAGHLTGAGTIYALPEAKLGVADFKAVKWTATAMVGDKPVTKTVDGPAVVNVVAAPKQMVFLEPDVAGKPAGDGKTAPLKPYEVTIAPGDRVSVWLRVDRHGNDGFVNLDLENTPHGVIVDSIGLNGVQIRPNENEREVFLSCEKWVPEQDALIHLVTGSARANESVEGVQSSFPVWLHIRKPGTTTVASAKP